MQHRLEEQYAVFRSTTLSGFLLCGFLVSVLAQQSVAGPVQRVARIDTNLAVSDRVVVVRRAAVRPGLRVVTVAPRRVVSRPRATVIVRPRRVVSSPILTVF
ncbi:MAG: hypothetical protein AAF933_10520 [Pseudomonadota bacterium]